ncbi:MAG: ATP-binding protein [Spongiibacteraceae bacterium]|jgi:two-component system sensor histidine kinase PhoQ|nr:ATP-binding protein [Spongiibacteraceae bacterium]
MRSSIRKRLLISASVVLLSFALVIVLALQEAYRGTLEESVRRRLAADSRTVMAVLEQSEGDLDIPSRLLENPRFNRVDSDLIALVFNEQGELIWRSPSAADFHPDYVPRYHDDQIEFLRLPMAGRPDYFIHDIDFRLHGHGFSLVTGDTAEEVDRSQQIYRQQLLWWLGSSMGGLVLLGAGLAWAMRPLRELRRQLKAMQRGERDRLSGVFPEEVAGLTRTLNQLLTVERERQARYRTTLDELAHGLKTPLAVVTELAGQMPAGKLREHLQEQVHHMNQQISYQLQRSGAGMNTLVLKPLPLAPVLTRLCEALAKVYRDKQAHWQLDVGDHQLLLAEAQALELFGNVLENAFRLCLQEVRITAVLTGDGLVIAIDDDGPGVPLPLRARVLERGVRADGRHEGQGLGLAVVADLLAHLGGSIDVDESELGGASFRLHFPGAVVG